MKLSALHLRTVSVPFVEPVPWRYGRLEGITSHLVELETDDGLRGLGEAPGVPSPALVREALTALARPLMGEDPTRVGRLLRLAAAHGAAQYPYVANVAVAAIEMALWDICGKRLGCPVHQLLGGLDAESVPFYWHVNAPDGSPETLSARAVEGLERGFGTLYLKAGAGLERDLAVARAVRRTVGPAVRLRIDPNEAWTRLDVRRAIPELEALELEFLEQPFAMHDHAAAAELRRSSRIPVAANQSAWLPHQVGEVLAAGAADVVVTGLHQIGGMAALRDAAARCRLDGVPLVRHSLCDLGVATAAALHVLGTQPPEQLAHQTHLTLLEHDLVTPSWRFAGGRLAVPRGAGLGVELDEAAVARCEQLHREHGEFVSFAPP